MVGHWTREEHRDYLQSAWGRERRTWQEVVKFVRTKNRKQLISHNQKMEKRLLKAVADGRLREPNGEGYLEHCLPSITEIVIRMANVGRFRGKVLKAIKIGIVRNGLYLVRDDGDDYRFAQTEDRFGLDRVLKALAPAHRLVVYGVERTTSPSINGSTTSSIAGDTDSGSSDSSTSPASSNGDEEITDSPSHLSEWMYEFLHSEGVQLSPF